MHADEFLRPRILIVSGKGGVGKTTVSAALALLAARQGRKVCVAEVDRKGTLADLFGGGELDYEPAEVSPGVWGMSIVPENALAEYLEVQYHMRRISKAFTSTQFVDYITTAAPGLKDILILGKIWYLERGRSSGPRHDFDTIIVDAPAAGHMLTFLSAPVGLSDAVSVGPIRRQADWLVQMLQDPKRSRVHLVSLAEEMPVSETLETAEALRNRLHIPAGAVVVNALYSRLFTRAEEQTLRSTDGNGLPGDVLARAKEVGLELDDEDVAALSGYARFLTSRRSIQAGHLRTLGKKITEPIIKLPFLFSSGLELPDIETLADALDNEVEKL